MPALDRYTENLNNPRPPGTGCHPWILSTATLGIIAGLGPEKTFEDIRHAIPQGGRRISDREITDAINKALGFIRGGTFIPKPRPETVVQNGKTARQRIIDQGKISHEADLWESSPIRLLDDPKGDPALFLSTLFEPSDLTWIGDRVQPGILGGTIRTVAEWSTYFRDGGKTQPHIIINPLDGIPKPTERASTDG